MITFRCGRCTERVQANDSEAGKAVTCPRCQKVNICPEPSPASSSTAASFPIPHPVANVVTLAEPRASFSFSFAPQMLWTIVGTIAIAGLAWGVWSVFSERTATAATPNPTSPAEALQQQILRANLGKPGDPTLVGLYQDINRKYFGGGLPAIPVMWEPRLADVGKLASQAYTLEGMFGHLGDKSVILLNPDLQKDERALDRALCHEIVHAFLFSSGDTTTTHGQAFQTELGRLSVEGAFEGILATDEQRTNLRTWLDAESARLDTERDQMTKVAAEIEQERVAVESALADIAARAADPNAPGGRPSNEELSAVAARRDAYNTNAIEANARAERDRADLEHFNKEVARYNLMLVYPDGLDETALRKAKPSVK